MYLTDYTQGHGSWAFKFILCEVFNVVVTVFTMLFTNYFLGGEFFEYGLSVSIPASNKLFYDGSNLYIISYYLTEFTRSFQ